MCASLTKTPVFGLPLPSCFVVSMPFGFASNAKGVPVATCAPYQEDSIKAFLKGLKDEKWKKERRVNVYVDSLLSLMNMLIKP